jgi:hypothetical protein
VLVAVGHAWEPLRDGSRAVTALYMFVYAFHMPAFVVISGCFSREPARAARRFVRNRPSLAGATARTPAELGRLRDRQPSRSLPFAGRS